MGLTGSDSITNLLSTYLDVQSRRAEVVASNLANAETPGYAAKEVDFADYLRDAARDAIASQAGEDGASQFAAKANAGPGIVEQKGGEVGIDGNNVDTGREMSTMAEAGMQYMAGTQLLQSRLRTLRIAIREGR